MATRRVGVTAAAATYAAALRPAVAAAIFAKRLLYDTLADARGAPAEAALVTARGRADAAARGVAQALGAPQRSDRRSFFSLFGGREVFAPPAHLLPLLEALYHLQRGPMLGEIVGHRDERLHLIHLCLHADLPLAAALVTPTAYQVRCCFHRKDPITCYRYRRHQTPLAAALVTPTAFQVRCCFHRKGMITNSHTTSTHALALAPRRGAGDADRVPGVLAPSHADRYRGAESQPCSERHER